MYPRWQKTHKCFKILAKLLHVMKILHDSVTKTCIMQDSARLCISFKIYFKILKIYTINLSKHCLQFIFKFLHRELANNIWWLDDNILKGFDITGSSRKMDLNSRQIQTLAKTWEKRSAKIPTRSTGNLNDILVTLWKFVKTAENLCWKSYGYVPTVHISKF